MNKQTLPSKMVGSFFFGRFVETRSRHPEPLFVDMILHDEGIRRLPDPLVV